MTTQDVHNYTSSSPHRLPTVSASHALQTINSLELQRISTGLKTVDRILQSKYPSTQSQHLNTGGLPRGHVTEVYGPPGVGKTTFAMQASANALHSGEQVIWVDAASPLVGPRFRQILLNSTILDQQEPQSSPPLSGTIDELLNNFHYFTAITLPHLLVLLCHPATAFPPSGTALIVVDSISTLFTNAFPRTTEAKSQPGQPNFNKKPDATQWAASRRWAVIEDCISKLSKLASTRNIAILVTSQTTTKVRAETGAVLHSALSSKSWDRGLMNRIVLYRGWPALPVEDEERSEMKLAVRYARVVKAGGVMQDGAEGLGSVVPFVIESGGLREIAAPFASARAIPMPIVSRPHKRKIDEVADSQSEDEGPPSSEEEYGWAEEDIAAEGLIKEHDPVIEGEDTERSSGYEVDLPN